MFSSATDLWATPQDFFDELDAEFHFDLDVCALPENAKCATYYTPEQDGLKQPWTGTVWCNPPYGRQIGKWVERGAQAAQDFIPHRIESFDVLFARSCHDCLGFDTPLYKQMQQGRVQTPERLKLN